MALVIEDGSGVTGADSFNTVAECTAHAVAYFGASLSGSDTMKESALRRAFVVMGALSWADGVAFPTFGGTIPEAVKLAQSILAREEFKAVNALSPVVTPSQQKVLTGVGAISWEAKGAAPTVDNARPVVTMALDVLKAAGLIKNTTGGTSVAWVARA